MIKKIRREEKKTSWRKYTKNMKKKLLKITIANEHKLTK